MNVNPPVRRPTPPPPRPQPPRPVAPPPQTAPAAPVAKAQAQARPPSNDTVSLGAPSAPSRSESDGGAALISGLREWKNEGDAAARTSGVSRNERGQVDGVRYPDGTSPRVNREGDRTAISPDGKTTESPGFQSVVQSNFAGWDADGNSFLSPQEIEKALQGDGLSADQAAALRSMRDSVGGIQAVSDDEWGFENDGITQKDIQGLGGLLRNEVTGRFAHDRTMTPEQQKATDEHRAAREALETTNAEMAKLVVQAGVDTAGVFDPTPVSDALGAAMSLSDGDLIGAAFSAVSMIPYAGDALGKTAKGARLLQKAEKLRERVMEGSARLKKAAERLEALKARKAEAAADAGSVGRTVDGAGDAAKTGKTANGTEALTPAARLSDDVLAGVERLPRSRDPELKFGNIDTKHAPRSVEDAAKTAEDLKPGKSVTWFANEDAIRKTLESAPDALPDVLARDPQKLKEFLEFLNPPKEGKAFGFRFQVPGATSLGEGVVGGGQRLVNDGTAYVRYQWARGADGALVPRPFHAYPVGTPP